MCRSKIKDSKRKVNEMINNESDLELTLGEHSDFFFIDSIDFDKNKNQAFAKISLGPKSKVIKMKID